MNRALCVLITISLLTALTVNAYAERTAEDVKREQKESEKNLEAAEEEVSDIKGDQAEAEAEVEESEERLAQIIASVSIIEDEIKKKTKEAEEAKVRYDIAKEKEEEQYVSMKRRIRYMYEHGGSGSPYVELFSGGNGFAEILNRSAYAEEIYEYDRNLLNRYQEARREVQESEERLQTELDELTEIKATYEEESENLQKTIDEQKAVVENFSERLAHARAKASQYKNQIAAQNAEIKKIADAEAAAATAKKKAEEEARKKAEEEKRKAREAQKQKEMEEKAKEESKKNKDDDEYAPEEEGEYEEPEYYEEEEESGSDEESSGGSSGGGGGSATGREIAAFAQQFLGNPYVAGGTSLTDGTDCSGFTMSVYSHFGYSIPRTSWEQQSAGHAVSYSDAQPGDLVCYSGHVGIYVGNNTICHASTPETGIKLTPATYRDIVTIRRIV